MNAMMTTERQVRLMSSIKMNSNRHITSDNIFRSSWSCYDVLPLLRFEILMFIRLTTTDHIHTPSPPSDINQDVRQRWVEFHFNDSASFWWHLELRLWTSELCVMSRKLKSFFLPSFDPELSHPFMMMMPAPPSHTSPQLLSFGESEGLWNLQQQ